MKSQNSDTYNHDYSVQKILAELFAENVVTIPTETVEGYAVLANSYPAIKKLMELKDRGFNSNKVFTLVPESKDDVMSYVLVPEIAKEIIKKHVPGEITLILPKNPGFKHPYYDHFNTIGIRIPDHPLFTEILPKTGPLILTSANPKGGTPRTFTGHLPSTIVDATGDSLKIIRQGNLKVI